MGSVGCSLMEAYNVPSFEPPRRRRGCVMDPQDIKASSEPYEPFQAPSPPEYAAAGRNRAPAAPSAPAPGRVRETFENGGPTLPKYYSGYSQDRKYYCDTYNICPIREGMTSGPTPSPAPTTDFIKPYRSRGGPGGPGGPGESCSGPLIAPNYEYPMSPEALEPYNKALQLSVSQPQGSTPPTLAPPLPPATGEVAGYTDEDLAQFLKTQDMKSVPFELPKVPADNRPVPGRDPQATPFAETMKNFTELRPSTEGVQLDAEFQAGSKKDATTPPPTDPWEKVWDMALFIVAGLLIILLLDQLFKLAMLYGMKRAFLAIEPLLDRALHPAPDV
jgi:hypothetical protein